LLFLFCHSVTLRKFAPILLWLGFYVIIDLATTWMESPPQAMISRSAPPSANATMMAVFKLASALAYFLLGWLGRFYEPLGPARYWGFTAMLPIVGLVLLLLMRRRVSRVLTASALATAESTGVLETPAAVALA